VESSDTVAIHTKLNQNARNFVFQPCLQSSHQSIGQLCLASASLGRPVQAEARQPSQFDLLSWVLTANISILSVVFAPLMLVELAMTHSSERSR
jgi:hypothetical protein